MTVEVEAKLVEDRFADVYRQIQRVAQVPGFREGKVPLEIVEKRFAGEAQEEVIKSLVPEAYHMQVAANKLSPVTLPKISEVKLERGKGLSFAAEFEKAPEFSLRGYKGIKIEREPAEVTDADVDKSIESLLDSRAELTTVIEARAVQKGDMIRADVEMMKDGAYVPGRSGVLLAAEPNEHDDFFEKIIGAQTGEVREISVDHSPEEKAQGLVGRKPLYKIVVKEIQQKVRPALDAAFAESFGLPSVEELKTAVRKDLVAHKQQEQHDKMKAILFDRLLAMVNFEVPVELVERQRERLIEQARNQYARMGVSEERFNENRAKIEAEASGKAREQVKLYFILQKVADEESIDVDEEVYEQRLLALSQESERPLDEVRNAFGDDLRESMREAKVVDFLLANAKLEEPKSK